MGFESPPALISLVLLPVAVAAYLLARRRRSRFAVRHTNVDVLRQVAPRVSPRRERLVALLTATALGLLCLAVARPEMTRSAPIENATVVLVIDTSRSMLSRDVPPTRLAACFAAAHRFLERAPDRLRVGLVTFAGDVTVAAYGDLGSRLGRERGRTEVTHLAVAAAGIALAAAAALGRLWAPALP